MVHYKRIGPLELGLLHETPRVWAKVLPVVHRIRLFMKQQFQLWYVLYVQDAVTDITILHSITARGLSSTIMVNCASDLVISGGTINNWVNHTRLNKEKCNCVIISVYWNQVQTKDFRIKNGNYCSYFSFSIIIVKNRHQPTSGHWQSSPFKYI